MMKGLTDSVKGWVHKYQSNTFLKNLSALLIVDILVRVSNIVLLPVYLRLMTQEEYGLYNYILSIVSTFSVLLNFGLYVSQSKYYADAQSEEKRKVVVFSIFFALTGLMAVIILPVYLFGLDYGIVKLLFKTDINYPLYRWSILLALVVSAYTVILSNFFVITEKMNLFRRYNIFRLITVHVVALSALMLIKQDNINTRLLYTYAVEFVIILVFSRNYFREMIARIDWRIIRNSLKLGIPVMISALWGVFSQTSDKYFLEKFGTGKELSCYYLAFSVSNLVIMVAQSVQNVYMPRFLKEKDLKTNIVQTKKLMIRLGAALTGLSILLILGLYIAIKIGLISSSYMLSIYILPILMISQTINAVLIIYVNYFIYLEKTHWGLLIGIVTSGVGVLGSYYLIAKWNVFGAALVFLGVQLVYTALYYAVINRSIKLRLLTTINH